MTLSDFIIQYRKEHNYSQRQFAALCNVSNGYISMIERNFNPRTGKPLIPTLVALNKIAHGMGMTIDELFSSIDDIAVSLSSTSSHLTDSLSPDESQLLADYRDASDEIRDSALEMLHKSAERNRKENAQNNLTAG